MATYLINEISEFSFLRDQTRTNERGRETYALSFTRSDEEASYTHHIWLERAPSVYQDSRSNTGVHFRFANRSTGAGVLTVFEDGSYVGLFIDLVNKLTFAVLPGATTDSEGKDEWVWINLSGTSCGSDTGASVDGLTDDQITPGKLFQNFGADKCFPGDDEPHFLTISPYLTQSFLDDSYVTSETNAIELTELWVLALSQCLFMQLNLQILIKDITLPGSENAIAWMDSCSGLDGAMVEPITTYFTENQDTSAIHWALLGKTCNINEANSNGWSDTESNTIITRVYQSSDKFRSVVAGWHAFSHSIGHQLGATTHFTSGHGGGMAEKGTSVLAGGIYQFIPQSLQEMCSSLSNSDNASKLIAFSNGQFEPETEETTQAGETEPVTTTFPPADAKDVKYRRYDEVRGYRFTKENFICNSYGHIGFRSVDGCAKAAKSRGSPAFNVRYSNGWCRVCKNVQYVPTTPFDIYENVLTTTTVEPTQPSTTAAIEDSPELDECQARTVERGETACDLGPIIVQLSSRAEDDTETDTTSTPNKKTIAIIAGILGSLSALALIIGLVVFFTRKRKHHHKNKHHHHSHKHQRSSSKKNKHHQSFFASLFHHSHKHNKHHHRK